MRAALGDFDVAAIIDGEEDVRRVLEIGESFTKGLGIGCLHKHEGHGRSQEDDIGLLVL